VSIRNRVERFIVWWPHGARKKKAGGRHATEALAQDNLYSLEVRSRREYIIEKNNDVRQPDCRTPHRGNSVQHVRQALALLLGIVSAVFIERDERTDGGQFHSIAVLSRRVLRSEKL
jgi:hypothetical protein